MGEQGDGSRYPWVVLAIVLVGSYLVVLDTTVLGVGLREIGRDLHASDSIGVDWVITSYLIAVGLVQPASAWLADRFTNKRVFMTALGAFTLASALAGAATSLELLIGARLLQGVGGGLMMPVGMAMVWSQFPPHKRGMAMSIQSVAVMAAPAFGPVLGGYVVSSLSWRLLFFVNVPIGLVAFALAWRFLRPEVARGAERLDVRGWALVSATVLVLVIGFREAGSWGWTSPTTIAVALLAAALFTSSVRWLLRAEHPLLQLRLFSVREFRLASIMIALMTSAMYARVVFLPTELQVVKGLSAQRVGLLFMIGALAIAAVMPVGGWLVDHVGARLPIVLGQSVVALSLWGLAHLTTGTTEAEIVAILVFGGLGIGLSVAAPQVVGMNALPQRMVGQATAVTSLTRQVASAIATSVLAAVVVADLGMLAPVGVPPEEVVEAYNRMFLLPFAATCVIAVLGLLLPRRQKAEVSPEALEAAAEAASGV